MKMLVSCPRCELTGRRQILGELKDGYFAVMRFHNGFTRIRGEFEVICNQCEEPVYFRTERRVNGTLLNTGIQRIYREGTYQGSTVQG